MSERALVLNAESLDRIGLEVDMRLTDVWSILFERGDLDIDTEFLGWLLRLAYVTGYWDALSEPERGSLCHQLGYPVPQRHGEEPAQAPARPARREQRERVAAPAPPSSPRRRACEG